MEFIPLNAKSMTLDPKTFSITYNTGIEAKPGIIVMGDADGSHGMIITNQAHKGGQVIVNMMPTRVPSKRYEVGEQLGYLIVW